MRFIAAIVAAAALWAAFLCPADPQTFPGPMGPATVLCNPTTGTVASPAICGGIYLNKPLSSTLGGGNLLIEQGGPQWSFHDLTSNPYEGGTSTWLTAAKLQTATSSSATLANRSCSVSGGYFPLGCVGSIDYVNSYLGVSGGTCGSGQTYLITTLATAGTNPVVNVSPNMSPTPDNTCFYTIGRVDLGWWRLIENNNFLTLENWQLPNGIGSASMTTGGSGCTPGSNVTFTLSGGTGTAATVQGTVSAGGQLTNPLTVTNAGNYSAYPPFTTSATGGGCGVAPTITYILLDLAPPNPFFAPPGQNGQDEFLRVNRVPTGNPMSANHIAAMQYGVFGTDAIDWSFGANYQDFHLPQGGKNARWRILNSTTNNLLDGLIATPNATNSPFFTMPAGIRLGIGTMAQGFGVGTPSQPSNAIELGGGGGIDLDGSGSGKVTIATQAAAGTYNFNLPTAAGSSGQALLSGGGGSSPTSWSSLKTALGAGAANTLSANSTGYMGSQGGFNANQLTANTVPYTGTLKNLYFNAGNAPSAGQTYTITVFTGTYGSASLSSTALTCTISGGSATSCNDTTHTASVTAGQAYAIAVVSSATASSMVGGGWGLELDSP